MLKRLLFGCKSDAVHRATEMLTEKDKKVAKREKKETFHIIMI